MTTFDALVVGAGPAGSITALLLARAGARVRLIDRSHFPRHKLCGDTINPGTARLLDSLGLGCAIRARGLAVTGMTVTGPSACSVSADYPEHSRGIALARKDLDEILLHAALGHGVVFDDGLHAQTPIVDEGAVTGVRATAAPGRTRTGAREHELSARIVIAADGRGSRLAAALGLSRLARHPRRWAFGAYFAGVSGTGSRGEMHIRPDRYIGIAPVPGGLSNVCVVRARAASGSSNQCRCMITDTVRGDDKLRDRFLHAHQVSETTILGPLAVDACASGRPGLLLAGDAGGFVDPMTGDGLRFAVRGAALAAEAALEELETGRAAHRDLHARRLKEFAGKWRLNRTLRALVGSRLGVVAASHAAQWWQTPVRQLITIAGDVP